MFLNHFLSDLVPVHGSTKNIIVKDVVIIGKDVAVASMLDTIAMVVIVGVHDD